MVLEQFCEINVTQYYKKKERKGEAVNAQAAFMKAALNARPPKTLPKAKKEKKSIFQKVFSAFGKRNRSC